MIVNTVKNAEKTFEQVKYDYKNAGRLIRSKISSLESWRENEKAKVKSFLDGVKADYDRVRKNIKVLPSVIKKYENKYEMAKRKYQTTIARIENKYQSLKTKYTNEWNKIKGVVKSVDGRYAEQKAKIDKVLSRVHKDVSVVRKDYNKIYNRLVTMKRKYNTIIARAKAQYNRVKARYMSIRRKSQRIINILKRARARYLSVYKRYTAKKLQLDSHTQSQRTQYHTAQKKAIKTYTTVNVALQRNGRTMVKRAVRTFRDVRLPVPRSLEQTQWYDQSSSSRSSRKRSSRRRNSRKIAQRRRQYSRRYRNRPASYDPECPKGYVLYEDGCHPVNETPCGCQGNRYA
jgi:uncharacterized phage infection (PIP) family protein YhgE